MGYGGVGSENDTVENCNLKAKGTILNGIKLEPFWQ
jgi:hypothetical protein